MGYPSRRAWLRCISSLDYAELVALSRLERIGLERTDLHAAAISGNPPEVFCHEPQPDQTAEELFESFSQFTTPDAND